MSHLQKNVALVVLSGVAIAVSALPGCGYPQTSRYTYEYAKALYSIANRKAADRLETVRSQITESAEKGDVTEREAKWLMDIINDAEAGRWEQAATAARKMMEDQTKKST